MGLLVRFDERRDVTWPIDPQSGTARRSVAPVSLRKEVETCGLCHARRAGFHEDWVPGQWLSQTHVVEPLARSTYNVDGSIRDVEEPYNYTPFKQSKMFAAGVTCSDCHEPHSSKLRVSGEGVCLQCHAAEKYADVGHRHHAGIDPAPTCISCHMPARTYMVVDPRHDHSFRVPRPDLSVTLGTPNACNDCHSDKPPQWAAAADRSNGSALIARGFRPTGRRSMLRARIRRMPPRSLLSSLRMPTRQPLRARARLTSLGLVSQPRTSAWREPRSPTPIQWYG